MTKLAAFAVFWASCAVLLGADAQHYLPSAGPNPLRFRPTAPNSLPTALLTPLPPPTDEAGPRREGSGAERSPEAKARPESEGTPAAVVSPTVRVEEAPVVEAEAPEAPKPLASVLPSGGVETMTPQMLLHYFRGIGGTNQTFVSLPVMFTPPVPVGPEPSSRATYSVAPGPVVSPPTSQ